MFDKISRRKVLVGFIKGPFTILNFNMLKHLSIGKNKTIILIPSMLKTSVHHRVIKYLRLWLKVSEGFYRVSLQNLYTKQSCNYRYTTTEKYMYR